MESALPLSGTPMGQTGMPEPEGYPHLVEKLGDEERMHRQLSYAKSRADVVMVFVHWGTEYETEIDEQQEYYRDFFYWEGSRCSDRNCILMSCRSGRLLKRMERHMRQILSDGKRICHNTKC